MKDSKLLTLLKAMSSREMKEFDSFLRSPYFSKGRDLTEFFNILKPFHPGFDQPKFTIENLYKKLYPQKKFDKKISTGILYTLSSELYKICKEFLMQTGFEEDLNRRKFYLLNKLREKKLYKEFEREYNDQDFEKENDCRGGANGFLNNYYLTHSYLEYCVESGKPRYAYDSIYDLGNYSALAALNFGYRNPDLHDSAKNYKIEIQYNFIDNLIENLDSEKMLENMKANNDRFYPYVAINYGIFLMSKNPLREDYYYSLKKLIIENLSLFGKSEQYILFSILCSYCLVRVRKENSEIFLREEFELYKITFELGIYKYNVKDKINFVRFRNIVLSAYFVNEIDWLEFFAEKYLNELESVHIENMRYYCDSYINMGRKNFEKALESIIKIKFDLFIFKIELKHTMIIIFYELDYEEQAYAMIDTAKHYLSKNSDTQENVRKQENMFLKYVTLLLKIRNSKNKKELNLLENNLKKEINLNSQKWLLEKVHELQK